MTYFMAVSTVASSAAAWGAAQSVLDYSAASPNPVQIDAFLAGKNSRLAGTGTDLSALAQQYTIDPRLIVAISGAETTFGAHTCAANNAWNWFHHQTCPESPFQSYQEGAEHVTKFLRLHYLNRGYDTIELIRYKYCTAGCDDWIPLVTRFYAEMPPALPAAPPNPTTPTASARLPDRRDNTINGIPLYLIFFSGAALVVLWSMRGLRK